jgi:hypothetical protein
MKRGLIVTALAFLVCVGAAPESDQKAEQPKQAAIGYALVRVVADPESGLANQNLIRALFMSDEIIRDAIGNLLHMPPNDKAIEAIRNNVGFWEEKTENSAALPPGIAMLKVGCRSTDERVQPNKLLGKIGVELGNMLNSLDPVRQRRKGELRRQEQYIAQRLQDWQKKRDALSVLVRLHQTSLDPHQVTEEQSRLDAQKQGIELSLKAAEARHRALGELIAELAAKVTRTADDTVVKELEKAVQARTKILESIQDRHSRDAISAEDELARAKAELARYRQQLAATAGGDRIAELQRQVQDTEIEQSELKAKLDGVVELIKSSLTQSSTIVASKRDEAEAFEQAYRQAISDNLRLLEKESLYMVPGVTVVLTGKALEYD